MIGAEEIDRLIAPFEPLGRQRHARLVRRRSIRTLFQDARDRIAQRRPAARALVGAEKRKRDDEWNKVIDHAKQKQRRQNAFMRTPPG